MIHLFTGPTLPANTASELLPQANLRPPVRHGDLLRLDPHADDIVAIVDGFFHQELAIRHKEILDLLARGIHVCGASSMGALRAAELHQYGMLGVGTIFAMLASGEIEGDDEVAVVHADAGEGYQAFSEALVDIRLHCRLALEAGLLNEGDVGTIIAAASALAYDERSYAGVLASARRLGLEPDVCAAYLAFVKLEARSAKREDALALVRYLRSLGPTAPRQTFELAETHWLYAWRDARRGWRDIAGSFITDRVVLDFIRVAARDYPIFHERVALEELAGLYGEHLGLSVPDAGELLEDFRGRAGFEPEQAWVAWCTEHHLREEELVSSLVRRARLRAVTAVPGEVSLERLRQLAGDYAVALGLWPEGEPPDAELALWLTVEESRRLSPRDQIARVAVRTFRLYPDTPPDGPFVEQLKLSGAFARALDILIERPPLPAARPRADAVLAWCATRWGVFEVSPLCVLDRGLGSAATHAQDLSLTARLATRTRRFYARAEASGDFPLLTVA